MPKNQLDLFICHASEDKELIARPLVHILDRAGITYWLDEAEIKWGDSIPAKVNEGLRTSRYVIVVLSSSFICKSFPKEELFAAWFIEATSGVVKVLVLLAGEEKETGKIIDQYPILNSKAFLRWPADLDKIVPAIQTLLSHDSGKNLSASSRPSSVFPAGICIEPAPPELPDGYLRRTAYLTAVSSVMFQNEPDRPRLRVILGPSGVGKSILAADFFRQARQCFSREEVKWIDCRVTFQEPANLNQCRLVVFDNVSDSHPLIALSQQANRSWLSKVLNANPDAIVIITTTSERVANLARSALLILDYAPTLIDLCSGPLKLDT